MMEKPIYDSRDTFHKNPFGAIRCGRTVHFKVFWYSEQPISLVLLRDETQELTRVEMRPGERFGERVAEHVFDEEGLYFYRFEAQSGFVMRSAPDSFGYLSERPEGDWFVQMVYKSSYKSPRELEGRIIYQIFPDRFFRDAVIRTEFSERIIHENEREMPYFRPVDGVVKNNDYFGGNLPGILEKLPYLRELGVGVIYLNPIFEAHSNHRYDTANYRKIDPLLGTEEDFRKLCAAARAENIYIILDGVFSHTGADSIYFDKYGRYGKTGAFHNLESPYRNWYKFDDSAAGYRSWWGFETLPEVNEDDPGFREYICGEGGVIDYWMSMGANGFRLDVADELPDNFIEEIRTAVKRHGDDTILVGEVWEDATTKEAYGERRRYLWGDELDSVMNYPFREAIVGFMREKDAKRFMDSVMEIVENYPKPMMDVMMNLVSTHDTDRLLTALTKTHDNLDREWQARQTLTKEAYLRGVELAKLAFTLLFTLPGLPSIYYGDEIGMEGYRDPFNRGYFRWGHIDKNLRDCVVRLSEVRRFNSAFKDGEMIPVYSEDSCVAYLRENEENTVFVMVNRAQTEKRVRYGRRTYTAGPWEAIIERVK